MLESLLSWRVLTLALAETQLPNLQEWEVRAMAAFLHERLPWYLRPLISEVRLELAATRRWKSMAAWYAKEQPRQDRFLFGS